MKLRHLDTVCGTCTAGLSVVCMSSMAAALAAAGAAAGAGAAGMGGMGAMGGAGGEASGQALSVLPGVFERLGLGAFNTLPNEVLQPLLVILLTLSVGSAYLAYRGHRRPHAVVLAAASSALMYASIYVWMSDALYVASLAGLVGVSLWGITLARPRVVQR